MVKILCLECGEEYELEHNQIPHTIYKCPACKELYMNAIQPAIWKAIIIKACNNCPHKRFTESADYCIEMPMGIDNGEEVWRQLFDLSIIHALCPLEDYKPCKCGE